MIPIDREVIMKKRPGGGQILELLDWAIRGGPAKWCDSVTYDADKTITQLFITANVFTVNAAKTLTLTPLRPLIVVADTINISGTITASGKGCSASADIGYRYTGVEFPFDILMNQEQSKTRNYCLCGSGGGGNNSGTEKEGGGAYKEGGAKSGGNGANCDLTSAELKELFFSPLFNPYQIGMGASGGKGTSDTGAPGGGCILLIGRTITLSATASMLANGLDASAGKCGGGGGGFVGLISDVLTVSGSATVTASGGAGHDIAGTGGAGVVPQIEV